MKNKLTLVENLLVGSLLFGLFFGAGNLIFPIQMGQAAGGNGLPATIGFLVTAVGLPLLGVVASAISGSESLLEMAKPVSKKYSIFFTVLLYLTIGPLFAIPRTATVAFEVGIRPFLGTYSMVFPIFIFILVFFAIALYFSLRPGNIIDYIGKFLTPTFLALLSIIILAVLIKPMGSPRNFTPSGDYIENPFFKGFLEGYNTMDALAALAFAILIIQNIRELGVKDKNYIAIETAKSGLICVGGMSLIYTALSYMGASSLGQLPMGDNEAQIFSMVSEYYFGNVGKFLLAAIVIVACLKTAIGLITACASMFNDIWKDKMGYNRFAIMFALLSFIIANFGLNTIISLSLPVLMFIYPLAIVLIILSLLAPLISKSSIIYKFTIGSTVIAALGDFLNAMPDNIKNRGISNIIISFGQAYLPGFSYGFGWILPSIIGFIIGLLVWKYYRKV